MSRIGKKIITLPEKTEASLSGTTITVKGPKGTLIREVLPQIAVTLEPKQITLVPKIADEENIQALWGTSASHLVNMVKGVNEPFSKKLIIEGIGFKAEIKGAELVLSLGFSHQVKIPVPQTLKVAVDKNGAVDISGLDKEEVGQFAAKIRALKKPEPYKGKGIHYEHEVVRRKQGKKAV